MSEFLQKVFGLTIHEKADAAETVAKLKGIATFFCDATDALKDTDVVQAIAESTPWWIGATASAAAQSFPVIKFVASLFEKLTEDPDPQAMGLLACTLAFQRSVEETMKWASNPKSATKAGGELKNRLRALDSVEIFDFTTFSLHGALQHPFINRAEEMLIIYLEGVGYEKPQQRKICGSVRRRFIPNLRLILSNANLQKRFKPFLDLIQMGSDFAAYEALMRHVYYQGWQFEKQPVFGKEPFSLKDVYIETECGVLDWGKIKSSAERAVDERAPRQEPIDAFSEKWGGRQPLLETVVSLLKDLQFNDAIIIQGAAGSGKSSFTLKLCAYLEKEGLYPIRIRLRDLSLNDSLDDALPKALFPPDSEIPEAYRGGPGEDPFRKNAIFQEKIDFDGALICPYIIILDGWDEISISAAEGFKLRVARMLEEIRSQFLRGRPNPVRVILTGRPSAAVAESHFLLQTTPILTIRPIRPRQLEKFVDDLRNALVPKDGGYPAPENGWSVPPPNDWKAVFEKYAQDYAAKVEREMKGERSLDGKGSMDVLGLPLLAYLAIRLIARWNGEREELIESPTTLYRHMVDLTCVKGGKSPDDRFAVDGSCFLVGRDLRGLLQKTAAAMTAYGEESISFQELALRLDLENAELNRQVTEVADNHVLTALMISFFFKGGHQNLGCEFLHKSFREYLFAESIVEALKNLGRDQRSIQPRCDYWRDFEPGSGLHDFSREICELFSPQWLSPDVSRHVQMLLEWEIMRSGDDRYTSFHGGSGQSTDGITLSQWEKVRDGLAELWHWWGNGVHLRPQPVIKAKTRDVEFTRAYVEELIEHNLPYDPSQRKRRFAPARSTTMDAHLGDALIRVTAIVHFQVAQRLGWLPADRSRIKPEDLWAGLSERGLPSLRCQSVIGSDLSRRVFFAPAGEDGRYFDFYKARINAAGWRPLGPFPLGLSLDGIDLRGCNIATAYGLELENVADTSITWRYANLSDVKAAFGCFVNCDFSSALARNAMLEASVFFGTNLSNADFENGSFCLCFFEDCKFCNSLLGGVNFDRSHLEDTNFEGALLDPGALAKAICEPDLYGVPDAALTAP